MEIYYKVCEFVYCVCGNLMVNVDQQHILQRRTKKRQAVYLQTWNSGTVVELLLTWKIIRCTYSECVFLAFSNQQSKSMCRFILLCVLFNNVLNFSTLSHERPNFQWRFFLIQKCLSWFFPQNSMEKFISLRRNRSKVFLHTCLSVWKCIFSIFFCSILMSSNIRFFKSVWWGTRFMDGWTDNHQEPNTLFTEMYKLPDVVHSGCYSMQQSPSSEATR